MDNNATFQDQPVKVRDEKSNLKSYNDILTKAPAQADRQDVAYPTRPGGAYAYCG